MAEVLTGGPYRGDLPSPESLNILTGTLTGEHPADPAPATTKATLEPQARQVRVGDIVIVGTHGYFGHGHLHPAIVTRVWSPDRISATVIPDGAEPFPGGEHRITDREIPGVGEWRFA